MLRRRGQLAPRSGRTSPSSATSCTRRPGQGLRPLRREDQGQRRQAVITGNWGNDLTLLVKAAREVGYDGMFYTFYGNALGAPAALGEAGVGRWWPWPTGCQTCLPRAVPPSTARFASASPNRRTTTCTRACSS